VKALIISLVVLLGLLVVADRVTVNIAEQKVAEQIARQGGLDGTPAVDITGFPFLTQAIAGHYDDIRIALTAQELKQPAGTRANVSISGASSRSGAGAASTNR